jgi:poly(3-hydroxyalkanoate) synthetase
MDLKLEKKTLKELIKNTYKENKLTKDILVILYK